MIERRFPPLYVIGEKFVEALEVHGAGRGVVALEAGPRKTAMGHASIRCRSWWMDG